MANENWETECEACGKAATFAPEATANANAWPTTLATGEGIAFQTSFAKPIGQDEEWELSLMDGGEAGAFIIAVSPDCARREEADLGPYIRNATDAQIDAFFAGAKGGP